MIFDIKTSWFQTFKRRFRTSQHQLRIRCSSLCHPVKTSLALTDSWGELDRKQLVSTNYFALAWTETAGASRSLWKAVQ